MQVNFSYYNQTNFHRKCAEYMQLNYLRAIDGFGPFVASLEHNHISE